MTNASVQTLTIRGAVVATAITALMATLPGASHAADCGKDATQMDLDQCSGDEFSKADAALNKDYNEVLGRLKGDTEARQRLVAAQRAWLAFRDAECDFTTSSSRDGSIYPMLVAQCRTTLTAARTKTLAGYLDCGEGDLSCPLPPK